MPKYGFKRDHRKFGGPVFKAKPLGMVLAASAFASFLGSKLSAWLGGNIKPPNP